MEFDAIIVGQGIAGTALALQLDLEGKKLLIIDPNQNNASKVAAGLINPLVYKRVTKSWMADTLLPYAYQWYSELETQLNSSFLYKQAIIKLFNDQAHIDVWNKKHQQNMSAYTDLEAFDVEKYLFKGVVGARVTKATGFVDTKTYLKSAQSYLAAKHMVINDSLDYAQLNLEESPYTYLHYKAAKIFFCEGYQGAYNPFFSYLPFSLTKGEGLDIQMDSNIDQIFTKGFFIKPQGENIYKIGSTFNWEDKTTTPTKEARIAMEHKLKGLVDTPFEIKEHWAGIRPTVKDRRPLIGAHPIHQNLYIFNGLGTKGVMLAPYFSAELYRYAYLCDTLNEEVNIKRFEYIGKEDLK